MNEQHDEKALLMYGMLWGESYDKEEEDNANNDFEPGEDK